jgi:histidinol dehydrogenase
MFAGPSEIMIIADTTADPESSLLISSVKLSMATIRPLG